MAKGKARGVRKSKKNSNNSIKLKPMKIAALILSAIQGLGEAKGSTPNKITGYISYASDLPENQVKRQVQKTLKRGVEYGILKRYQGHYFLQTGDELERANKVATRFARLPASPVKSNPTKRSKKAIESPGNNRLKPRKTSYPMKQRQSRSLPTSPTSSLSDTSSVSRDSFSEKSDAD